MVIGNTPWTADDMRAKLEEFASLYAERPIKDNDGGMQSPHLFLFWFALQFLKPKVIIESGVWKGQGTWFMEHACPDAELYCLDITWKFLQYRSKRAHYIKKDFSKLDWRSLPKDQTVAFFDDHANAVNRCRQCFERGFKHLLFEDNYPPRRGDCYSLKEAFAHAGHIGSDNVKHRLLRLAGMEQNIAPNARDAEFVSSVSDVYAELPPVFKSATTRWGDSWGEYATPEPLLASVSEPYQQAYLDEARSYTWMCYVRLKDQA